jgi:hypothetical protein
VIIRRLYQPTLTKPNVSQHRYTAFHVARIQRIMEPRHWIPSRIRNFLHLRQLIRAARCKIQKREAVEIFSLLVGLLHDL